MKEKILSDIVIAMKAKDKDRLQVLRMIKGAIQLEEIEKKTELKDDEVINVVSKQIKTRRESISQFGDRKDLIDKTQSEIDILMEYMPEQLSTEEIEKIVNDVFLKVKPESQKDMGKIMGSLMPLVKGKADMTIVNKIIKDKLN